MKYVNMELILSKLTVLASHRDIVLSAEQVTSVLEKGRNCILLTESACPLSVYLHLRLPRSQILLELSMEQVARKSPLECQLQPHTVKSTTYIFTNGIST